MATATPTPALAAIRRMFRVAGVAAAAAAIQLYLFPGDTDRYFAWTLNPPLAAAFMGAGFGAGVVLVLGMWGQTRWAAFRLSFVAVFTFSTLTLAASLIHRDRLHLGEGGSGEVAAWIWLVVYLVVPVAMAVLWLRQRRVAGIDPEVASPLPRLLGVALGVIGVAGVGVGLGLFVAPGDMAGIWPWALTPFAARALAAWLIALGLAALLAIRERDLGRLQVPALAYLVFGGLALAALVRFGDQVTWDRWSAWALVLWLLALIAVGVYGELQPRRSAMDPAPTAR